MSRLIAQLLYSIMRFFFALVFVAGMLWAHVFAETLTSSNYRLEDGTFSTGGLVSGTSASYILEATFGEALIGDIVATDFSISIGFQEIMAGVAVAAPAAEEEAAAPVDGGSGAAGGGGAAAPLVVISEPSPEPIIPPEPPEEPAPEPEIPPEIPPEPPPEEPLVVIEEPPPTPPTPPEPELEPEPEPLFPFTPDITIPPAVQGTIDAVVLGASKIALGVQRVYEKLAEQPVFQAAQEATRIVLRVAEHVLENPAANATAKTITTTGVIAVGAPSVISLASAAVADPAFMLFRIWGALLSLLGIRRRGRPWGTVYDSVTKQPLDPAYVMLMDPRGKEIATDITDLDGRFGFLVPPGTYYLRPNKTHYDFPSKRLAGKALDEVYANLYFGEPITITGEGGALIQNIPMDPAGFDWNEYAKREKKLMKFYSRNDLLIGRAINAFFVVGALIATLSAIVLPGPYNLIVAGAYVLILLLRILGPRQRAYGTIATKEGDPLSFAIIRVFNASNIEILHTVCDERGRYFVLVPNGEYRFAVEKKVAEDAYEKVYESPMVAVRKGILKERVRI